MARHWVADVQEIQEGQCKLVEVKGISFGIYKVKGSYYAWRNVCPHAGAPVCKGLISGTRLTSGVYEYHYGRENELVRCPWHGWEFDLTTGEHLVDPQMKLRAGKLEQGDEKEERLEAGVLEREASSLYLIL